jgi:hypothetical protein
MKTEIKNEDDVEASFRAGLSHFAHQPSPPSARRLRHRGPPPIPKTSPSPPPTVTVAAPPQPPSVKLDADPDDGTLNGSNRVSARIRKRKKGETGERLNTGATAGASTSTRPSKKRKKDKTGGLAGLKLKVVSDYLAEDLDGTCTPKVYVIR